MDKAFTSIALARHLATRRIAIVGMIRTAGRPKSTPKGPTEYFPFNLDHKDLLQYERGKDPPHPTPPHPRP
jgi:hypothetical protein